MPSVAGAKLATAALLLVVGIELRLAEDGNTLVTVLEGKSTAAVQPLLVLCLDGQHDGDGLIGDPTYNTAQVNTINRVPQSPAWWAVSWQD